MIDTDSLLKPNECTSFSAYMSSPYRSIKHLSYFKVYDKLLSKYIGKPIVFLEIGVLDGGSLFMWREFFGKQARIIGVDLNPDAKKWVEHGFEIFIGDQSDPSFWQSCVLSIGYIDVVLDDGGHTYQQQIVTTACLLPNIANGGLLIVEDTHTSYLRGFGLRHRSFIEYSKKLVDRLNKGFFDEERVTEPEIYGIYFFRSMVAFSVDRGAASTASTETDNGGIGGGARDFRSSDNEFTAGVDATIRRLTRLKALPYSRKVASLIRHGSSLIDQYKNSRKTKKYF